MRMTVGYCWDIGGGVAYACQACRDADLEMDAAHDTEGLSYFWPLDPAKANGTERCESCGNLLVGGDA